jgi:hypothetical protein
MEGIYRISGTHSQVLRLERSINNGEAYNFETTDPYTIASLFKRWIRECNFIFNLVPECVLTDALLPTFYQKTEMWRKVGTEEARRVLLQNLSMLISQLPEANIAFLSMLMLHLKRVSDMNSVNLMNVSNLEVVFSPTLGFGGDLFFTFVQDAEILFSKK